MKDHVSHPAEMMIHSLISQFQKMSKKSNREKKSVSSTQL